MFGQGGVVLYRGPHREGDEPKPMMHEHRKSDIAIVAVKPANKAERSAAELVEPRAVTEGNADRSPRAGRSAGGWRQRDYDVSQELGRIRRVAKEKRTEQFTALLHHVDVALLKEAFLQVREDAAPGVDGVTRMDYERDLERNLKDLHVRVHRGTYRALPSRRVFIPKPDGRQRPIAIAALEDKIVQRAVVMVLNEIYEEDFLGFSYGFRQGRGAHDALDALVVGIESKKVNWILDADIKSFFDEISRERLIEFLERRIGDRRIIHLIQKWLRMGVLEDGVEKTSEKGTAQGAVISPLLANVYLHYVLDLWAEGWRQQKATGDVIIARYADDFIVGFEREEDARRFLDELRLRFAEFALTLHPEKTRLIEFGRYAVENRKRRGLGKAETFNFLGFTFICGKSRDGKKFLVKRKTRRDRMQAKLKMITQELSQRRHQPIPTLGKWLGNAVKGYFNYFAVPTNYDALAAFRDEVISRWIRALRRRSQRDKFDWPRMKEIARQWLPRLRIIHPWPRQRFNVKYPRWEPYAGKSHVRLCAGGVR